MSKEVVVTTSPTGVRTVKAEDIIQSPKGRQGLKDSKELFERLGRRSSDAPPATRNGTHG